MERSSSTREGELSQFGGTDREESRQAAAFQLGLPVTGRVTTVLISSRCVPCTTLLRESSAGDMAGGFPQTISFESLLKWRGEGGSPGET
jgi:hypothetical protein